MFVTLPSNICKSTVWCWRRSFNEIFRKAFRDSSSPKHFPVGSRSTYSSACQRLENGLCLVFGQRSLSLIKRPPNEKPPANPFVLLPPSVDWLGNGTQLETKAALSNPNWIMSQKFRCHVNSWLLTAARCHKRSSSLCLQIVLQLAVIPCLPAALNTFKDAQAQDEHLFLLVSPSVHFSFSRP